MMSKEYLSFTKRERTGIITLVILLIIVAVIPKFFCNPRPIVEKLPDKQLQQLAERKTNYYTEKKYRERDTVYVREYAPSRHSFKKYHRYGEPANPLFTRRNAKREGNPPSRFDRPSHEKTISPKRLKPGWVRPKPTPIDINIADTSAFIALPGIGSKLANRIVSFRTKLGGFNSVEQIKEVYGLKDSVFQIIQPLLICQHSQ